MPRCHWRVHFSTSFFSPSVNVFPPHYFTSHLIADRGCCSLTLLHTSLYLFKWMDSPFYDLGEPCEDLLISKWMIFKLAYFLRKWCKDICFWVSSDRVPAVQTPGSLHQSAMQTQANIFLLYKSNHLSVLAVFTKKKMLCVPSQSIVVWRTWEDLGVLKCVREDYEDVLLERQGKESTHCWPPKTNWVSKTTWFPRGAWLVVS